MQLSKVPVLSFTYMIFHVLILTDTYGFNDAVLVNNYSQERTMKCTEMLDAVRMCPRCRVFVPLNLDPSMFTFKTRFGNIVYRHLCRIDGEYSRALVFLLVQFLYFESKDVMLSSSILTPAINKVA